MNFELKYFINYFKIKSVKKNDSIFLKNIIKKSFFFLLKNLNMPFYGDISPDYSPKTLVSYFKNKNSKLFKQNLDYYNNDGILFNYINYTRINYSKWVVFIKHTDCSRDYFLDHSHEDESQVIIFYNNNPILIDCGRLNYENSFKNDKYCLNNKHNLARLNGLSLFITRNFPYLPYKYKNHPINIKSTQKKDKILMLITSRSIKRITNNNEDEYLREIEIKKNSIIISDKFKLKNKNLFQCNYHFPEELKRINNSKNKVLFKKQNIMISSNNIFTVNDMNYSDKFNTEKKGNMIKFNQIISDNFSNNLIIESLNVENS